jgi:hypothetical protein
MGPEAVGVVPADDEPPHEASVRARAERERNANVRVRSDIAGR